MDLAAKIHGQSISHAILCLYDVVDRKGLADIYVLLAPHQLRFRCVMTLCSYQFHLCKNEKEILLLGVIVNAKGLR